MDENQPDQEGNQERNSFYSILNVHPTASFAEINERHRALSLVFHPDRHQNEEKKEVATTKFLEIQKAYQVLSDPFLREVYDTLGEEGLDIKWPEEIHFKSKDEIRDILDWAEIDLTRRRVKNLIFPQGKAACLVDASPLFAPFKKNSDGWIDEVRNRVGGVRALSFGLVHSAEKRITQKTSLRIEAQVKKEGQFIAREFCGTLRHQFSPRLTSSATVNFFYPFVTKIDTTYSDNESKVTVKGAFIPPIPFSLPPINISISRRLSRRSFQQGELRMKLGKNPQYAFFLASPTPFNLSTYGFVPPLEKMDQSAMPPTISGLGYGTIKNVFGINIADGIPKLMAQMALSFEELGAQLSTGFELGFDGLSWTGSMSWSTTDSEIEASTTINSAMILFKLELSYLEQRLSMPVIISTHVNTIFTLCSVVVPSTAVLLGYHFFVKPRRRARRLKYIRSAKKAFDEDSDARKQKSAVEAMLKDTARRHMEAEARKEGLVIQEATYGSFETDEEIRDLMLDVTIPVQALVRNSQLYIRGSKSKAAIQGFFDPAPFTPKALRVRYLFHGRMHYAEIPDYLPVVLPLAEHQVDKFA